MSTGYGGSAHDRSIVSNMELFRDGGRDAQGNLYFEEDEFLLGDKASHRIIVSSDLVNFVSCIVI